MEVCLLLALIGRSAYHLLPPLKAVEAVKSTNAAHFICNPISTAIDSSDTAWWLQSVELTEDVQSQIKARLFQIVMSETNGRAAKRTQAKQIAS